MSSIEVRPALSLVPGTAAPQRLAEPFLPVLRYLDELGVHCRLWTMQQTATGKYLSLAVGIHPGMAARLLTWAQETVLGSPLWVTHYRSTICHALDDARLGVFMQPTVYARCGTRIVWLPVIEGRTPQSRNHDPVLIARIPIRQAWQCPSCSRL